MGGITYTNGEVGQAFVFNTTTSAVKVATNPTLNVGAGAGFTVECWINPSNLPRLIQSWNGIMAAAHTEFTFILI